MKNLIWVGPAFTIAESLESRALTPAASRWQQGLLGALAAQGCAIDIVTHRGERIWPLGRPWFAREQGLFQTLPRTAVAYANVPGLRVGSLALSYLAAIDRLCGAGRKPDAISSYNVWGPVAIACREAAARYGIPWLPFLLDHDRPTAGWSNVLKGIRGAAGVAFVSHWAYEHAPFACKLHLDAGVAHVPAALPSRPRTGIILYSGALHQWGGIETLLDAMPLVRTPDVRLVVVGRGGSGALRCRLETTPGVEYRGGVDEATLMRLTEEAEVLANPRPRGVQGNEMNFPSKLMHYLSSLKPVATTITPGVAPEYREVVIAADDDTAPGFAAAIDRAFSLSDAEWAGLASRIQGFLAEGRLWSQQAKRFMAWADEILSGRMEAEPGQANEER